MIRQFAPLTFERSPLVTTVLKADDMCFKYVVEWANPCPHSGEEYAIFCGEGTKVKGQTQCENAVTYRCVSQAVCGRCGEGDEKLYEQNGGDEVVQDDWRSTKGEDKVRSWGYQAVFTWKDEP